MPDAPSELIENIRVKLGRLNSQIEAVAGSEHPNIDSRDAVLELRSQVDRLLRRLNSYEQYPPTIQASLLKQANYIIFAITDLLGFLIRATSTRNLFELYFPFLTISRRLVNTDVHLILSSDWKFSPFTYPFGLDELPNYILIGLPASESENVLIFPTAAHELGHNIWRARAVNDYFKQDMEQATIAALEASRPDFERIYGIKNADFQNDMFVQPVIRHAVHYLSRQLEESFCDFVGLIMFGQSYVYAFDYLLAPAGLGRRSYEYPSSKSRVEFLTHYGTRIGVNTSGVADRFTDEILSGQEMQTFPVRIADRALKEILDKLFDYTRRYIEDNVGVCFSADGCSAATTAFQSGVPTSANISLGDMLNAAWSIYNTSQQKGKIEFKGVDLVAYLTDLVVKSAETFEYRSFLIRA